MGVAADPLPHQIANVCRLLDAPELRHLLADGVGLGKTIQTLMLLNALRLQDSSHRTLLVVPDHLANQWLQELTTRGHSRASFLDDEAGDRPVDDPVRLIKPSALGAYLEDGPERYDLLVLDEPQSFTVAQRDALARARPFPQFLALTASPELGRPDMLQWFMSMLEPLRPGTQIDPLRAIRDDESRAVSDIAAGADGTMAFERDAFGRRICRWSRTDWPDYMPRRDYVRADVPPFARETALADTARRLLSKVHDGDATSRARALHRVGRAAREALASLPAGLHAPAENGDPEVGDSRLDALLDRMASLRGEASDARILIVAGDNDTVARLERILPSYLKEATEGDRRLRVGRLSRGEQNASDVEGAIRRNVDGVGGFVRGDDDILLLGDWAESGLNLHHGCENLVFYSCPWNVRSIDQLVGRLDRLRSGSGRAAETGRGQGRIGIHVITWAGSPEADIVDGLEQLGIFERPLPPMSVERAGTIDALLADLASGRRKTEALSELARMNHDGTGELERSLLASFDPYTPEAARELYGRMVYRAPLSGTLAPAREISRGREAEEAGLAAWLEMLGASRLIDYRRGLRDSLVENARYSTAWYGDLASADGVGERPFVLERFERRREGDRRATPYTGMEAFLIHRRHIADPPLRTAADREGKSYPLCFLDHGDPLHEQLCEAMIGCAERVFARDHIPVVSVRYPPGHRALEDRRELLVTVAARRSMLPYENVGALDAILSGVDPRDAPYLRRRARASLRADERWFSRIAPLRFVVEGIVFDLATDGLERVTIRHVEAVLDPRAENGRVRARSALKPSNSTKRLQEAARRRRDRAADMRVHPPSAADTKQRTVLVEEEWRRAEAETRSRAARRRAEASNDHRQARISEARALRIEKEAAAVAAIAAMRLDRLRSEPVEGTATVWQLILQISSDD
nr:SNF2-related protein [Aureimonas phyllosphaerae]